MSSLSLSHLRRMGARRGLSGERREGEGDVDGGGGEPRRTRHEQPRYDQMHEVKKENTPSARLVPRGPANKTSDADAPGLAQHGTLTPDLVLQPGPEARLPLVDAGHLLGAHKGRHALEDAQVDTADGAGRGVARGRGAVGGLVGEEGAGAADSGGGGEARRRRAEGGEGHGVRGEGGVDGGVEQTTFRKVHSGLAEDSSVDELGGDRGRQRQQKVTWSAIEMSHVEVRCNMHVRHPLSRALCHLQHLSLSPCQQFQQEQK